MLSAAVPQKVGSLAALAVVSVDVATPKPCHPGLVVPDSMLLPAPVDMVADSAVASVVVAAVEVSVAAVVSVAVVIALEVLVGESDIKATAMASVDKLLQTLPQAPVVDVEGSEVVMAAPVAVADSTVE